MKATKNFDTILKELGDLYEFNREIQRFSFRYPKQQDTENAGIISEKNSGYEVRNTHS